MNRVPQALHHTGEILLIVIIIIIIIIIIKSIFQSDTTIDVKNFFPHKTSKNNNEKIGKKLVFSQL
jgi:ABC-type maltose transport system permease subunit